jgi:hypothetical protein
MFRRLLRVCPALALPACTFGLAPYAGLGEGSSGDTAADGDADADADTDTDADADTDADGDADAVEPTLDAVDPAYGTTAGGTTVVLSGADFTPDVKVRIGGSLATISALTETSITAVTPGGAEGATEVRVATAGGEAALEDAFTYYADGTGKIGVLGSLSYYHYLGTYWSGIPEDYGYALMYMTEPADFDWSEMYGATLDTCSSSYVFDGGDITLLSTGGTASLTGGAGAIDLTWKKNYGYYLNGDLTSDDVSANTTWGFTFTPDEELPAFDVADFVTMPGALTITSPNLDSDQAPQVSKSFEVRWNGAAGDGAVVVVGLYASGAPEYAELLTCVVKDDGSFTIPNGAWSVAWPSAAEGRQVDIMVGRYAASTATLPPNNAGSMFVGEYWARGAAFAK